MLGLSCCCRLHIECARPHTRHRASKRGTQMVLPGWLGGSRLGSGDLGPYRACKIGSDGTYAACGWPQACMPPLELGVRRSSKFSNFNSWDFWQLCSQPAAKHCIIYHSMVQGNEPDAGIERCVKLPTLVTLTQSRMTAQLRLEGRYAHNFAL